VGEGESRDHLDQGPQAAAPKDHGQQKRDVIVAEKDVLDAGTSETPAAPQRPGWYRNILANPEVEVQVGTAKMKARARTAAGDERAWLWERALEFWPPYADYQKKTEREIPVVVPDTVR